MSKICSCCCWTPEPQLSGKDLSTKLCLVSPLYLGPFADFHTNLMLLLPATVITKEKKAFQYENKWGLLYKTIHTLQEEGFLTN